MSQPSGRILHYRLSKGWGNVISVTVKKQKKYKTVRCKLEIMHAFDTWERDHLWIAPLGPVVVRWFPASWSLKERKERERFQAVVQGPPDSFTAEALAVKEHLTNFVNPLHIKAFKEVKNPDGTRKMIAYFESWEDLQNILSKESFWNGAKLSWCRHTVPSFITRRKVVSGLIPIGKMNLTSRIKAHLPNVPKLAQDPRQVLLPLDQIVSP
ncbi:hypothetical protein RclHR1_01850009 [Rhizophagus clarus]|uniref:Uncharacterized protein n=1 Tax=Rhizophagus clarus TaxID=94130 RepID=A0A2Z6QZX5_9GLOM|nr:hypothetical protein RclHR1_01850009 [Rhizophagus clarus]